MIYQKDSSKAEEFIHHEEILDTLEYAQRLEMAVRISGKLPSSVGRGALPDGRRGVGTAPCEPTHLARIPQQPRVALHTFGREGALPGNGAARGAGSELPQAVMMLIL